MSSLCRVWLVTALALAVASLPACPGTDDAPEEAPASVTENLEPRPPGATPEPEIGEVEPGEPGDPEIPMDDFELTWLTPEVRTKILALPSLEPRSRGDSPLFRPTGEMRVMEEKFGAKDSVSLLVAVEAEQRFEPEHEFSPATLFLRVVIDCHGEVASARYLRTETAADVELYELLGVSR